MEKVEGINVFVCFFKKRAIKEEKIATSAFVGHLHRLHRRIYKDYAAVLIICKSIISCCNL